MEGSRPARQVGWPWWDSDQSGASWGPEWCPVPPGGTQPPEEAGPDGPCGTTGNGGTQNLTGNHGGGTAAW